MLLFNVSSLVYFPFSYLINKELLLGIQKNLKSYEIIFCIAGFFVDIFWALPHWLFAYNYYCLSWRL